MLSSMAGDAGFAEEAGWASKSPCLGNGNGATGLAIVVVSGVSVATAGAVTLIGRSSRRVAGGVAGVKTTAAAGAGVTLAATAGLAGIIVVGIDCTGDGATIVDGAVSETGRLIVAGVAMAAGVASSAAV